MISCYHLTELFAPTCSTFTSCDPSGCDYRLEEVNVTVAIKSSSKEEIKSPNKETQASFLVRLQKEDFDNLNAMCKKLNISRNELVKRVLFKRHPIDTPADYSTMKALLKVNGDMGRVGGLLKLWLSNDSRVSYINVTVLYALLGRIESTRDEIRELVREYKSTFNRRL